LGNASSIFTARSLNKQAGCVMKDSDLELLRQWQGGDAAAFEGLVRRWQGPVGRFVFHMTGRREEVDDLAQEVFLRAYVAGRRFRPEAAFSTWLFKIALNVVRDAARKRSDARLPENTPERSDPHGGPEQVCSQHELAERVAQAVAGLPEEQRAVVVLRHYEGMSFEEIGRVTGTPPSTLKSRFAAAMTKLRQRLGPEH
jgi:RNA polymerase sigma-70 factor (ECF subfamily)